MSMDTIVSVTVSRETRAPSQRGFGTPLLVAYHDVWPGRVHEYGDEAELLDEGFTTDHFIYKTMAAMFAQTPSPDMIKVGRRANAFTQIVHLIPREVTVGFEHSITLDDVEYTYEVEDGDDVADIVDGLVAAMSAADDVTASSGAPASVSGTVTGPWALAHGDTLLIAVDADVPGSPDTATFSATAAARESASETWDLSGGKTLTVSIDGGAVQTVNFVDGNFATPAAATAAEVAAVINAQLTGASVEVTDTDKVTITSDRMGTGSGVNVTGGTANAGLLAFTTGNVAGTGNVSNIAAVTFAEVKTIVELATDAVVTSSDGKVKLSSPTAGDDSEILVTAASTADDEFGLDNATHTGSTAGESVVVTADTPGVIHSFKAGEGLDLFDATTDPGLAADLAAIRQADTLLDTGASYGFLLDSNSAPQITALGTFLEGQIAIGVVQSADWDIRDAEETGDIATEMATDALTRTGGIYHKEIGTPAAACWMAKELPKNPGQSTWAHKTLALVPADRLTTGEQSAINAKRWSHYTRVGGQNITFEGKTPAGEFLDIMHQVDFSTSRIQEAIFGTLTGNDKVPQTNAGIEIFRSAIYSVLKLCSSPEYPIFDPTTLEVREMTMADVPTADRANRILRGLTYSARLTGAFHRVVVKGRVYV